ncbi:replicative DNA helicase [Candidatus Phytoplasma melaleucae]|uniref:Replicative DNA helicase n=1 Tax=Candidatus Phytoplasma melaleucae TaxID=2982630 RepID=A0ABT9DDP2_9MOLU|nr:replicative DNA helicase ['Melaleuca sp.' phytoplasma]MDO8167993.1 replicative DNA helicase ['Melaleuca sp.' phytoplasma]MDV3205373.1 replicative DNA helicase [Weeping tea tree witches'-broom phytoplasma]
MNNNIKLPYCLEAEQSILGIIFLEPQQIMNVINHLEVTDFFNINHQYIFMAMQDLFSQSKAIDYYSVYILLQEKDHIIEGGQNYLIQLGEIIPSIYHLNTYITFVQEAAIKRNIIQTASAIVYEGLNNPNIDPQHYLNVAEEKIFQISSKQKTNNFVKIKTLLAKIQEKVIINHQDNNIIGLSTGYYNLDEVTLGLKPEELIIIAARPSMGKSSFMMNLAVKIAQQNKNTQAAVAIFSLEMSNEQLSSRMLSAQSEIPHKNIQLSMLNENQLLLLKNTTAKLENLNIYFDDSVAVNILDIRTQCRKLKYQNKLDIVIIDYLQLIKKNQKTNNYGFYNRQEEVSDISKSLKQMARELKIPVIALSQLSREVEKREEKRPILSDLRDSGSIEQDADIVMFLYRKHYYSKEHHNQSLIDLGHTELIIAKNRQGITGVKYFNFDLNCLLFRETNNFNDELF